MASRDNQTLKKALLMVIFRRARPASALIYKTAAATEGYLPKAVRTSAF